MKQELWVQRRFAFDLPVKVFPGIVERLRGTPARLEERVRGLPPEILTRRPEGGWSIQEHVGHLGDLEPLQFGRMQDYLSGAKLLRPGDLSNRKTWDAEHNSVSIETLLESFRTARARLVKLLESFDESTILRTSFHPRLKAPMRVLDLNYFWAEHDDHHLARISELIPFVTSQNEKDSQG